MGAREPPTGTRARASSRRTHVRANSSNRPGGTRTPNRRFWRPVLYQLSYGPLLFPTPTCRSEPRSYHPSPSGQGRNRTADTTIFSRVLYQLSYLAKKTPGPASARAGGASDGGVLRFRYSSPARAAGSDQVSATSHPGMGSAMIHCAVPPTLSIIRSPEPGSSFGQGSRSLRRPFRSLTRKRRQRRRSVPNSGGGIRTRDLRVMSPTSYQAAPPRNKDTEYTPAPGGCQPWAAPPVTAPRPGMPGLRRGWGEAFPISPPARRREAAGIPAPPPQDPGGCNISGSSCVLHR
jgi:hypothetical protein